MFKTKKTTTQSSAEVIDNHLILSLTNANEPIVWRMELTKIGTASFEIKEIKTNNYFKLVMKPKKGTAETIATFETKDAALNALNQASDALQKPCPQSTKEKPTNITSTTNNHSPRQSGMNKWTKLLIGLLVVIILYAYLLSIASKDSNNIANAPANYSSESLPNGVPLSADDLLNGL